jgi:hypothetical protein
MNMKSVLLVCVYLCSAMSIFGQEPALSNGCPPVCDFQKFDEIRTLSSNDLKVRLDNLATYLQRESSGVVVYLIAYAGPVACVGEAQRLSLRAKKYLVRKHRIASHRLFVTDGGYREGPMLEIWMLPSDVTRPEPHPTVDRSQVRLKNCNRRGSIHRCRA